MTDLVIRRAHPGDAARIAEIYNHYVLHSTATFDTEPKTVGERLAWLSEHDDGHPVLVGLLGAEVVAWGALSKWGTRAAYRHTVEISVYVDTDYTSRGIGPALSEALIEEARHAGHHAIIGQIVADNEVSLRTSVNLGFERIGVLREVGRKFDRWLDVVLMERPLPGPYDQEH
jgi:phosphinothricin acetyltransferase